MHAWFPAKKKQVYGLIWIGGCCVDLVGFPNQFCSNVGVIFFAFKANGP